MSDKPMGGSELMYNELIRRIDTSVLDNVSIFNYPAYADVNKKTIYWNQLSYDQQSVMFLKEAGSIDVIDHFVFVSHWQSEIFRKTFNIPGYKTSVIKNACIGVSKRKSGKRDKLKICYTSTPWRGLDILLGAWELLNPQNCELHIFSDTKIYGTDFANNEESKYQYLYDKAKSLNGVVYRGTISNEELRNELGEFDIIAYPSTFEETSCISVIDGLSAGLRVICSNLGALPETTEGWARMYPYLANPELHIEKFANILNEEINFVFSGGFDEISEIQSTIYSNRWSWDRRILQWNELLKSTKSNPIPKYFCMIHTEKSKEYTYEAIESFIKNTKFAEVDRFFLIDNDNSFVGETQGIEVVRNQTPKSFAQNINQILTIAIENNSDFVLLSNDIIFTPNWLEPLVSTDAITVPISNQQVTARTDNFELQQLMDLEDYLGNEIDLEIVSNRITTNYSLVEQPKVIPYYCFYLPHTISSKVGLFDENFGLAGGEDIDYRLRAEMEGYETKIITKSFLLHFMGKSTWRGAETGAETNERNQKYYQYFISKWGEEIAAERFDFE